MQQSMQISLLCSTEHKEENMIFINSPFAILDEAFRSLYPDKKYKACIEMTAMLKGSQDQNEKEDKLLRLLLTTGESNLTN